MRMKLSSPLPWGRCSAAADQVVSLFTIKRERIEDVFPLRKPLGLGSLVLINKLANFHATLTTCLPVGSAADNNDNLPLPARQASCFFAGQTTIPSGLPPEGMESTRN